MDVDCSPSLEYCAILEWLLFVAPALPSASVSSDHASPDSVTGLSLCMLGADSLLAAVRPQEQRASRAPGRRKLGRRSIVDAHSIRHRFAKRTSLRHFERGLQGLYAPRSRGYSSPLATLTPSHPSASGARGQSISSNDGASLEAIILALLLLTHSSRPRNEVRSRPRTRARGEKRLLELKLKHEQMRGREIEAN